MLLAAAIVASGSAQAQVLMEDSGARLEPAGGIALTSADFDGDTRPDLALMPFGVGADEATIWMNRGLRFGRLELLAGAILPVAAPQDVRAADLDADADADLVIAQDSGSDGVAIFINRGGTQGGAPGSFERTPQVIARDLIARTLLGDVDGDGDRDLVIVRSIGRDTEIWLNNGLANFTDSGQRLAHASATAAALGDLDGDSDQDLLVVGQGGNKVWMNQGGVQGGLPGSFAALPGTFGSGLALAALLLNLDADADLDAVIGRSAAADELWFNQGGVQAGTPGTFALARTIGSSTGQTRGLAAADLDNSGSIDLARARSDGVRLHPDDGDGIPDVHAQILGEAEALAVADFDSDGTADLALARLTARGEIWLGGASPGTPAVGFDLARGFTTASGRFALYGLGSRPFNVPFAASAPGSTALQVSATAQVSGNTHPLSANFAVPGQTQAEAAFTPTEPAGGADWTIGSAMLSGAQPSTPLQPPLDVDVVVFRSTLFGGSAGKPLHDQKGRAPSVARASLSGSPMQTSRSKTPGAPFMGSVAEVLIVVDLRDLVMVNSVPGRYYISLWEQLQGDFFTATLSASPTFYYEVWRAKDLWVPAIDNLAHGDGMYPISAAMIDSANRALDTYRQYGSLRLREAIDRERARVDINTLVGQPISELRVRMEAADVGILFRDGFESLVGKSAKGGTCVIYCLLTGDCTGLRRTATDAG